MFSKKFLSLLLILIFISLTMQAESISDKEQVEEYSKWPIRIDYLNDNILLGQIPFTYGLPANVGVGFTADSPLAGIFVTGDYLRTKKVFFNEITAEKRQIKMFLGISSKPLFEAKFKHDYFDNIDISFFSSKFEKISSIVNIPLTASYELRAFGSFDNPVFTGKGFAFSKAGPLSIDLRGHFNVSPNISESFFETGFKWQNLNGVGVCFGNIVGIYGSIPIKGNSDLISNPRFGMGFLPDNWSFTPYISLREKKNIFGGTLDFDAMVGIPIFGESFWFVRGTFDFASGNQLVFDFSQNTFFLGGRLIILLPKI